MARSARARAGPSLAATEVETDHAVEGGQQVHAVAARLAQGHGPAIGLPGRRRTRPLRCRQRRAQGDAELGLAMVSLGIVRQLHQTVERRIEMGDRLGHGRPVKRQPACPQPVRDRSGRLPRFRPMIGQQLGLLTARRTFHLLEGGGRQRMQLAAAALQDALIGGIANEPVAERHSACRRRSHAAEEDGLDELGQRVLERRAV